ncbi:GAF domain-containing protein [Calothrix sp. PCC 7507]|uniref:sensor histidine kinase n=1 Tax=Calothrix sp. PCC 7507 TaxID=99598 RepID=UPI00029EE1D6|nr:GAF domain-containing protein [Calothrix sp. PCC 7507]AFY34732.1 GAF sensor signal transduction histidine kinase [Calothrix sp. PCC 7507]
MKKRLSSPSQYQDDVDRLQTYQIKLMQHQEEPALQLVQKINQIIANRPATASMLQELAQLLGVAFKVDCCSVTVTSEASSEATIANWCTDKYLGLPQLDEIFSMEQLLMDLPVVQCAAEPLTIEDISTIQKSLVTGCQSLPLPIKAVLAIPARFGGKNNGVVSLIKFQPYDWSQSEKQLLKAIESSCAIAFSQVAQSQLIASQQQYLQKSNQHQSLIKQLTILSRSNLELNQMLQLVIASTAESLQADRGLLILLKYTDPLFRTRLKKQIPKAKATVIGEWTRDIEIYPTTQPDTKDDKSFAISDCGLCQRVFADSGKPVIIDDYTDQKEVLTAAPLFAVDKLPAVLLMPLENQGKVLGFLVLQQTVARSWQLADLNLVEMVSAQVSNAIIQSQTLRQVQNLVDERTAKLQSSLELQAKLHERTRQYVEQLRELNELKDEFLSNMSDRLRYPLTNMLMSIRNLRLPGIAPERQTKYFDILEQECTKEINLINDLLTLQKLESQQEAPQFQSIDLNLRIQDLTAAFSQKLADKGLSITVDLPDEPLKLQTEVESFDRILQELLTNACKYSERESVVHLQATHQVDQLADQVIIKVTNIGRGISEAEATYIFDKFRRGKGRWTPGTGLGLALAKSLVQHLNGAIAVKSMQISDSDLSEICFTLTLPQFSDESKPYSESD